MLVPGERKLGEILQAAKAAGQIPFDHGNPKYENKGVVAADTLQKVKLSDAGISRDLSSRAQKLATVPKHD